jgi:tetratricopeptide (TPR) repeat protein
MRSAPPGKTLLLGLALFAATVALYYPSTRNGFLYDDRLLVLRQEPVRSVSDAADLLGERYYEGLPYYRPLTAATFAVQKTIHGETPFPFHLFNVLAAAVVAILVFALLRAPAFGLGDDVALVATAAYLAHPVVSSCVDPVSGRDTMLAIGFVVAAMVALLERSPARTAIGVALLALGLLTKEAAVVGPGLVLLADALKLTRPPVESLRGFLYRAAPLAAIVLGYAAIRASLFSGELHLGSPALVPLSYVYLLQVVFVPFAALLYEPAPAVWMSALRLAVVAGALAALALAAKPVWRAVRSRIAFWTGWALLGLLPAANLVRQETLFDERYVALAALGIVGAVATVLAARFSRSPNRRGVLAGAWCAVLALAVVSHGRAAYFEEIAFYRQWSKVRPGSVTPHFNLGNALSRRGDLEGAIAAYRAGIAVEPRAERVHYSLALALARTSRLDLAEQEFREAIRLDPKHAEAHDGLGSVLAVGGDLASAVEAFRASIAVSAENPNALRNLGFALVRLGRNAEAIPPLREAIRLEPGQPLPHRYLGAALLATGQPSEAARSLEAALRLDPSDREASALLEGIRSGPP